MKMKLFLSEEDRLYKIRFCYEGYNGKLDTCSFTGKCMRTSLPAPAQTDLKFIAIPKDVVRVDPNVFAGCQSLEAIVLHDGLEIAEDAFINCPKLKYLIIPGYDPNTCRFFYNEYDDGCSLARPFAHQDEYGVYTHIGEVNFRQDSELLRTAANPKAYRALQYSDPNIIVRTHWIRMSYFAFDNFLSLKLCAELPEQLSDN